MVFEEALVTRGVGFTVIVKVCPSALEQLFPLDTEIVPV
jgi:hypothetical protein